jgi:hypothetical protein
MANRGRAARDRDHRRNAESPGQATRCVRGLVVSGVPPAAPPKPARNHVEDAGPACHLGLPENVFLGTPGIAGFACARSRVKTGIPFSSKPGPFEDVHDLGGVPRPPTAGQLNPDAIKEHTRALREGRGVSKGAVEAKKITTRVSRIAAGKVMVELRKGSALDPRREPPPHPVAGGPDVPGPQQAPPPAPQPP